MAQLGEVRFDGGLLRLTFEGDEQGWLHFVPGAREEAPALEPAGEDRDRPRGPVPGALLAAMLAVGHDPQAGMPPDRRRREVLGRSRR